MPLGELDTFVFKGQTRFRCPDCPFDSHNAGMVAKHWAESHSGGGSPTGPTLFDADDKPIQQEREIILPWADPFSK